MREEAQPISMLTAYDFPTARMLDEAGIDVLLVGDSLAMVVQGHDTTLPVTIDQMIYHAEMVGRAANRAMVVVDLPFPEGQLDWRRTVASAARVLKETRCHAVKLEGGAEQAERIKRMVDAGIPVMAHVGLRPQNVHVDGGYRVSRDVDRLVHDATAAEQLRGIGGLPAKRVLLSQIVGGEPQIECDPGDGCRDHGSCTGDLLTLHGQSVSLRCE